MLSAAMPELLRAGKLAVEKGQAQGRDEAYVKQLTDYIIQPLVEAMHKVWFQFFSICTPKLSKWHSKEICGNSLSQTISTPITAKLWTSYLHIGDMVIGLSLVTDHF